MGDELRGENLVHLNVRFSTETELKKIQDFLYEKSGQGVSFTGLVEAMANEVTIVTAVHNIKSNKGSRTAGVDKMKMDKYLQMPKDELILLIQSSFRNYRPKPARREYIEKSNGKKRPLGIPTVLDRIIQECVRIIIEPICEARFYPQSYGFRPYRAQKHAIRGIINVINAGCKSPDQPVWAIEGDIKGCFDNINHRLLLQKLWRIGIHDKRVLKIISQMLKAGYMENDLFHATELGTPQGGILSPLLSNVYLNDFDWYVGRMYMEPHRQCKHNNPFIHVNPPYQLMVIHSSKLVYPRELYQRGVERKRVELIAAHFNEYVANEPKVSFRNGQFIVTDGQHTIEGRILRNGGKDLPILCKVYTGMTVEQEALLFAEQNGFSAPLTAGIRLRAKVVGGDAISKAFLAATNRVGLSLNYDSQQLTDYRIGCVGTAFRLYKQMGEPLYCETMRLIVAAWEGKPDSFRASVLKGMMHFVELYHGEFNEERLLRALRNIHPVDIYRIGQDDPAKLRGWKKYVFPIYTAYNGKCRKDALPMKF